MDSSSTSRDGEITNMDVDGPSIAAQPGLTPREGQLLRHIANLQHQLNVMSQRQEGPVPHPSYDVRARSVSYRGSAAVPGILQQTLENGGPVAGYPGTQQIPPQGQGQPFNPPPPPLHFVPQLVRRGSFTLPVGVDTSTGARQLPPGWSHLMMYRLQMNPQTQPQTNPQVLMRGPLQSYWDPPRGPPPPYPGLGPAPAEIVSTRTSQAGPSRSRGRKRPRGPGSSARSLRPDSNDDTEDDDTESDTRPSSRPGRSATRMNPTRGAGPTNLRELE